MNEIISERVEVKREVAGLRKRRPDSSVLPPAGAGQSALSRKTPSLANREIFIWKNNTELELGVDAVALLPVDL